MRYPKTPRSRAAATVRSSRPGKRILGVECACLALALTYAGSPTIADDAPQASANTVGPKFVLAQNTWDFGEKWRGEPASGSISFSNGGDAELKINRVKPSCGCTGVHATKMTLQPGESAELVMNYDTNRPGDRVTKVVRIFTNEPDGPEHRVQIVGKVRSLVKMEPQERLLFGALSRDQAASREIVLRNLYDEPLDLELVESNIKGLKVELEETEPGKVWRLRGATETPLAADILRGDIVLKTGFDQSPTVKVPVYGRVQPRVALTPPRLYVPERTTSPITRTLRVTTRPDVEIHVTEVKTSNPLIEAKVVEPVAAKTARPGGFSTAATIQVTLPPADQLGAKGETITIHTDDPETPVLTAWVSRAPRRSAGG